MLEVEAMNSDQLQQIQQDLIGQQLCLDDFEMIQRLGKRHTPVVGSRYYGCNSSVFLMTLKKLGMNMTVRVGYNFREATADIEEAFQGDWSITEDRERRHPQMLVAFGHFVGEASVGTLGPSWDLDPDVACKNSLFVAMEQMDCSLQDLIRRRKEDKDEKPPFFSETEFLCIMHRLTNGACHLLKQGIVHRDVKVAGLSPILF